jgi:hypothetical protein
VAEGLKLSGTGSIIRCFLDQKIVLMGRGRGAGDVGLPEEESGLAAVGAGAAAFGEVEALGWERWREPGRLMIDD